jgi:D-glycero-alpha-D-manno-heptose-7-phosphate kinase
MIIASSPVRISLGSADHSPFAERFIGNALNIAINKRVYLFIRERNSMEEHRFRVSYSNTELCEDVEDIKLGIVREAIKLVGAHKERLEIVYVSDTPPQLGLGTSSSMAVALLKGLWMYKNTGVSNEILVEQAYRLERVQLKERGGFQDQYAACFGGLNYLEGCPGRVQRKPIALTNNKAELLKNHMLLVYTGNTEHSSSVLEDQLKRLQKGETLDDTLRIKKLVEEMFSIMQMPDFHPLDLVGPLRESWELKKQLTANMSGPRVSFIEQAVLDVNSAAGLRLIGGGGDRGVVLIVTDPKYKEAVKDAVAPLKTFDVDFDWDGVTARRIFHGY